jgi:hypothetical protein
MRLGHSCETAFETIAPPEPGPGRAFYARVGEEAGQSQRCASEAKLNTRGLALDPRRSLAG